MRAFTILTWAVCLFAMDVPVSHGGVMLQPVSASTTAGTQAGLIINVTGDVGSGVTTWNFSGSYNNTDSSVTPEFYSFVGFGANDDGLNNFDHDSGELSGEYVSDANHNFTLTGFNSSSATVTGSSTGGHSINGLFLDSDGSSGSDDFAWFADGTFNAIEILTFAGSAELGFDITTFGEGATAIMNPGDTFTVTSTSEITPLSMTFTANSSSAAVPEPSTLAMFGLGLGLAYYRRRNLRQH
ncbi:MAG TPA: hypothetical protein DDW52_04860 [Planctomycetaceae bacterium]|nr:hypothetical protein [Planctomycetaceae bacterium]